MIKQRVSLIVLIVIVAICMCLSAYCGDEQGDNDQWNTQLTFQGQITQVNKAWMRLSNHYKPPFVYGFGPTVMLPTATDEQLGTGKYSAGPMGLAMHIGEKWIIGGVVQHWWSFAGDDRMSVKTSSGKIGVDRPNVNLTDFQYILRYSLTPTTNVGAAPKYPLQLGFGTAIFPNRHWWRYAYKNQPTARENQC